MDKNYIKKIKRLNFDPKEYVVVGSGILNVLNIRKAKDIDIAITRKLHKTLLKTSGWRKVKKYNLIFLKKEGVDIIPRLNWDRYKTTTKKAIKTATIIDGIPFMNLKELIKFKKALGRKKDLSDIKLIEKYLNK